MSVGNLKLSQPPNTRLPSFRRINLVVLELAEIFPGQMFRPVEFPRRISPAEVNVMAPERSTGVLLADQTTARPVTFRYQIESLKRFEEPEMGENPAAKKELGERRVRFCVWYHGKEKEEFCCCCAVTRKEKRRKERRVMMVGKRFMVVEVFLV